MSLKRIGPLALAVAIVGLMVGCGEQINHDPVIQSITATPDSPVRPEQTVTLTVTATDEDGDELTFTWNTTVGQLSATTGETVVWTAPNGAANGTVTVVCDDDHGGQAQASKAVSSIAWQYGYGDIDGETADSSYIRNPGTTETVFVMDPEVAIPSGAVIDSAFVNTYFDPVDELELEQFYVWAVSPAGTQVLLYDGFNLTNLEVDDFRLAGTEGQTAEGTWKIKVERQTKGVEGCIEDCELEIYFHYRY